MDQGRCEGVKRLRGTGGRRSRLLVEAGLEVTITR